MRQHLAFFDPKMWSSEFSAERSELPKIERIDSLDSLQAKVEYESKEELRWLRREIIPDVWEQVDSEISDFEQSHSEISFVDTEKDIYKKKWWAANISREAAQKYVWRRVENWKKWDKNIKKWYTDLLKTLEKNNYFDHPSHKDIETIRDMYLKEVNSQYEKYVRTDDEEEFDRVKDSLFWPKSEKYPANEVYTKLTWASTIFDREKVKVGTYDVTPENDSEDSEEVESQETSKRVEFLAHDLPNYLWEVKDKNAWEKLWRLLPFFSVKVDRASLEDKKQIENFVEAVDKVEPANSELALLKVFDDLSSNATDEQLKKALADNNLSLKKDRYLKDIKNAFQFYNATQTVDSPANNQHALYLSILQVVKAQGWFDKAINAFEKQVADYKERMAKEGKEFKKWDNLDQEFKSFAEKLWIQDFTSATRLAEKGEDYFKSTSVVDILADINNDGTINFADRWLTKTWVQFKEIYNMVWEDVALSNLLAKAKLLNSSINGEEGLSEEEFTSEQVKAWNKKLILLLQNIISNPWVDLRTLMMYGPDASDRYDEILKLSQDAEGKVDAVTDELLKDIDLSSLDLDGVEVASAEWLHQAVAWALYTEYTRWIGLWSRISFEEWAKWLSLNWWIQATESGVSIWLNLAYNREINLWRWWSVAPWASIWFIPMFKFWEGFSKPEWNVSGWVELAKEWINNNNVQQKIWLRGSFTEVVGVAHVFSAFLWWERDKAKWIEQSRDAIRKEFSEKIITPLLDNIAENLNDAEFDLTKSENVVIVNAAIDGLIDSMVDEKEKSRLGDENLQRLKANTVAYLLNYNKAPISNKLVRQEIARELSNEYAAAWAEQRISDIDWKGYLSGARIWFSWVMLWAYGLGVAHLWVSFKKHRADTYGDNPLKGQTIEATSESSVWTAEMLEDFNKNLISTKEKFRLENWYIVVPLQAISDCEILVNPGMKWLMKKDESGNILLSAETYMNLPTTLAWTARKATMVLIWWWSEKNAVELRSVLNDESWFTSWNIDASKLTGKEVILTQWMLDSELSKLKAEYPKDEALQNFTFDETILPQIANGDKYEIILKKEWWKIVVEEINKATEREKPLAIEYRSRQEVELMSNEAKAVAETVYGEARKVTSNALYNISHDKNNTLNAQYREFAYAVMDQDYAKAKTTILAMLPKMDKYINQYQSKNPVDFKQVSETLQNLEWAELGKALMSINNVFARVSSVHGGVDWAYHFKRYDAVENKLLDRDMWSIIESRAKEISWKIDRSKKLDEKAKNAYKSLINFAESYRKDHAEQYKDSSKQAETLENAIWINLWNAINIENPLFNPEVYSDSIIKYVEFDWKDTLMERALNVIAKNIALMDPIKKALWVEWNVSVKSYENGQLNLDINGKNVILKADMKFAYFAQCVNHMLILDNIVAEIPWERKRVEFGPSVMWSGKYYEWTKRTSVSTTTTGVDVAFTAYRQEQEADWSSTPGEDEEDIPNQPWTSTPWAGDEWGATGTWWTPNEWWEGNNGNQWGWRNGEGWGDNNPVWWEGQSGHQWGGR